MAFTITYDNGRIAVWKLGEVKPEIECGTTARKPMISCFQATGDELAFICKTSLGIPLMVSEQIEANFSDYSRCIWRDWTAQFIYDNL